MKPLRPSPWQEEGRSRGSVLALVPAGFLVLVVLAALAVDSAVAYLGQRQLHDALVAAANDGVAAGMDNASFYGSGTVALDPASVERAVCTAIQVQDDSRLRDLTVWVAVAGTSVRLRGQATVDAVFGRALPGYGTRKVSSSADASFESGPGQTSSATFGPVTRLPCT